MNQKQAKRIRQFIKRIQPGINTRAVRYKQTVKGERVVDRSCFRGMYLQSKKAVKEESQNV